MVNVRKQKLQIAFLQRWLISPIDTFFSPPQEYAEPPAQELETFLPGDNGNGKVKWVDELKWIYSTL